VPDAGPLDSCSLGGDKWIFAASIPGQIVELKMPDTVGVPLQAATEIVLNMHFINTGTTVEEPQVKVNLLRAQNFQYTAAPMVAFNDEIDVPGATAAGPGSQTVSGTCTAPAGSNFFVIGTATNGHAAEADVNFVSGGNSTNVVHTTDWRNPDVGVWPAPQFLTVQAGDSFVYSCDYSNATKTAISVGESESSNEKCMVVSYFFPAGSATCN
jgi:hypothetical protein